MSESNVLYSKEGFVFTKNHDNKYTLSFEIENDKIIMEKIIDFNLLKLIYDLNGDIFEQSHIDIINENDAVLYLLTKHFFEDLGMPQRFSYVRIKKTIENNNILFTAQPIKESRPKGAPINSEFLPLKKIVCICLIITPHKINFSFNVIFDDNINAPLFVEKLVGLMLYKIFIRLKQFIENVII